MKLTKYEHACQVLEKSGGALVIDPGAFTLPLDDVTGVVAIVITHEHPDHWTADHIDRIRSTSPDARILAPAGVAAAAVGYTVEIVAPGDTVEIEPFTLRFFGGQHAVIHSSIPVVDNVGVMVDDSLYYGGDSYSIPDRPVEVLAVPIGAPWLKIGEVMDYVAAIAPRHSYPVHEAPLSVIGKSMAHGRVDNVTSLGGGTFVVLEPGDSLDL